MNKIIILCKILIHERLYLNKQENTLAYLIKYNCL